MRARQQGRATSLIKEQWGRNVRRERLRFEETQEQFAARCGTDQSTVSRLETGDLTNITIELMLKVASGCDRDPADIFHWPLGTVDIFRSERPAGV